MSDEDALIAAIIANPDEDTPRLVYADWLEEHGDAGRGEFIRLQCRNAARDPDQYDPTDEEREAVLEDENRGRWLAGAPQFPWAHWHFRRGFPESLEVPADLFLERYTSFARFPWLRAVCLTACHHLLAADFANRDWNPNWVELELHGYDGDSPVGRTAGAFASTSQARQLYNLWFLDYVFDPEAVEALAASPHLVGLRVLGVPGRRQSPLYAPLRERFGDRLVGDDEWIPHPVRPRM